MGFFDQDLNITWWNPRPSSASIFALAASELASATEEEAESKMSCATSWPAFLERNIWTPG